MFECWNNKEFFECLINIFYWLLFASGGGGGGEDEQNGRMSNKSILFIYYFFGTKLTRERWGGKRKLYDIY